MKKLLIVDLQKQFRDSFGRYQEILDDLPELMAGYDVVYATVFSQTVCGTKNPNFEEKLRWSDCSACSSADLEFDIEPDNVLVKNGYGLLGIDRYFAVGDTVDLIGCDLDACVMAVCFQLWDMGIDFRILSDYVYTTSSTYTVEDVLQFMRRNFGDCVC